MNVPESPAPSSSNQVATVLIADDAPAVRGVCRVILAEHGYRVLEAADGRAAVAMYARHRPHVVLLDINMPRLDGLDALIRIRELNPQASVVMVTALGDKDRVLAAIRAGAQDFVVKPFQVKRLLYAINKLLSRAALSDESPAC